MSATDQVKNFFGLSRLPFSKGLSVNEIFKSSALTEAISRLEIAVENEEAALLTGESGSGKSNVVRYFVHNLDTQNYRPVYFSVTSCKIGEIAKKALDGLNIPSPYQSAGALRKFRQAVIDMNTGKNQKLVLIIDEAQELPPETLIQLKSLMNYHMDNANMVFILLCGQKIIEDTLMLFPLESLNRRIRIRYEVEHLSLEETASYIQHHLKMCQVQKNIFSDEAMALIYQFSRGLISDINRLCFDAVILAAAQSKQIIEQGLIDTINRKKE